MSVPEPIRNPEIKYTQNKTECFANFFLLKIKPDIGDKIIDRLVDKNLPQVNFKLNVGLSDMRDKYLVSDMFMSSCDCNIVLQYREKQKANSSWKKCDCNIVLQCRLFINNEFVNSGSGKTFPTINPATGEKIADVQEGDKLMRNLFTEN
ncbi:hypothetical protein KUTeg_022583 [Tegillarca granosa]|uniref:Uncharacterized protein n=1 Tax=Tegillarca granosa TaxID=220873 RepID=A0ABQ9E5Y0_TEGGR|nr:hypothetical protein KUTeg_022583 [Tegillarca granosa]